MTDTDRPPSAIVRSAMPTEVRRGAFVGAAIAVVVFVVLLSGGHADGLWREGPYSSNFFDEQAHSLLEGRLDVDPDVASIEGFRHDGRTYFYFGLVPSVLRMPVLAVTDAWDGRLTQVSMLAGFAVALWAAALLVWRARRSVRGAQPVGPREPWVVGSFVLLVGLGSPLLFLASRPLVYHEAEMWGAALALMAAEVVLAWWERPSGRRLVIAAVVATLAFNTRPSVGSLGIIALAIAIATRVRAVGLRATARDSLAVVIPLVTYAAVNFARFGRLFSVSFEDQVASGVDPGRQAALAANDGTLFNLAYLPTTIWHYVRPDGIGFGRLFPFVRYRDPDATSEIGNVTFDVIDYSASLPTIAPVLVLLAVVGIVVCVRHRHWPWLVVTVAAAASTASTLSIGFIAQRYLADFTPLLALPAALGVWWFVDWLRRCSIPVRRIAIVSVVALAAAGFLVTSALTLTSQRRYVFPERDAQAGFIGFAYDLDARFLGGTAPGLAAVDELPDVPGSDGDLVIVGDCDGLYQASIGEWRALERAAPLVHEIDGPPFVEGDGSVVVATTEGWRLVAESHDGSVRFAYVVDGEERHVESVPIGEANRRPLRLVTDPGVFAVQLLADGDVLFDAFPVDASGALEMGAGWSARSAPTPLCERLADHLES